MGHLWGIEVEILIQDGDLVAILFSHPFSINAEYHLRICVTHLAGNETWVSSRTQCPTCECMSGLICFSVPDASSF